VSRRGKLSFPPRPPPPGSPRKNAYEAEGPSEASYGGFDGSSADVQRGSLFFSVEFDRARRRKNGILKDPPPR
jgi:hypothetical protein